MHKYIKKEACEVDYSKFRRDKVGRIKFEKK